MEVKTREAKNGEICEIEYEKSNGTTEPKNDDQISEIEGEKFSRKFLARQILVVIGPFIITLVRGYTNGYSSTLIPSLKNENRTITTDQEAWLASAVILPAPIGAILSIMCVERLGRRITNLISCPLWCISWLIVYFAEDVPNILVGRFVGGVVVGYVVVPCVMLVAESTSPRYRGAMLVTINLGITLGSLVIHTVGTYLTWEDTALFAGLFVLPALVVLFFVPESPAWYCMKGRVEEAQKSFRWTRGTGGKEEDELAKMIENAAKENSNGSILRQLRYLSSGTLMKPFGIFVVFVLTVSWSGSQAVMFFSVAIAQKSFKGLDEYLTTIIMDAVRVTFSLVSCVLGRYVARRPHLLISTVGSGLALICLAVLLFVSDDNDSVDPVIILVVMLVYVSLSNLGLMSLIYVLIGELYPLAVRGLGQSLSNSMAALALFSVVQASPYMLEGLGMAGTYIVYGCVCFVGAAILFFILPETREKTLLEIEQHMKS